MLKENFSRAREYLRQHGLKAEVAVGTPVSERDLNASDAETDFPMPVELRRFYLELGDGFAFFPDVSGSSTLVGWEYMHLADHKIWNKGFSSQIEEEATREIAKSSPRTDRERLHLEMTRRKRWMPFYGFAGGGDVLCLDLNVTPPSVRFYEAQTWVALPKTWDFTLALSFTEFVERWSSYGFLSPAGAWTSFCARGFSGEFDWAPGHFPRVGDLRQ